MSVAPTVRVMSPQEIAARAGGETPYLHWPERSTLFAEREMRLRQLASGHAMRDFLLFMADVAHAQHGALTQYPVEHPGVPVPDGDALDRAARAGLPPLPSADWPRDPAWRAVLRRVAAELQRTAPPAAQPTLERLLALDDDALERQADRLLTGVMLGLDLATAPLIAAALQVHWTHLVLEVQRLHGASGRPFGRLDDDRACPCCGSRPTASITRTAGDTPGQRYLHCSLCSMQWHMLRIQCTHCGSSKSVAYQALQPADATDEADGARAAQAALQAETCDECDHYLKIVHQDKDPHVEPVADDLASLTLDLLVSEHGKQRHGVNLMLLFGDPDAAPPPDPGAP